MLCAVMSVVNENRNDASAKKARILGRAGGMIECRRRVRWQKVAPQKGLHKRPLR